MRKNGEDLERLREIIVASCSEPPPAPTFCPELVRRFNRVRDGYTLINDAMGELP